MKNENINDKDFLVSIIEKKVDLFEYVLKENFLNYVDCNPDSTVELIEMYIDNFYVLCNVPGHGQVEAKEILHRAYKDRLEIVKKNKGEI